jgi:hypothetical protein
MVEVLRAKLGIKTKVEVVRRGLQLLKEATDRTNLRAAYRQASASTRGMLAAELHELDHLASDGLEDS